MFCYSLLAHYFQISFSSSISFFLFWAASLNISQAFWLGGYFPCTHCCSAVCRSCTKGRKSAGSIVLVTFFRS